MSSDPASKVGVKQRLEREMKEYLVIAPYLAAFFVFLEHVVSALLHHRSVASEFQLTGGQGYEMLARVQLMLVAFVPFFAFREISAVLGEGKLVELFFRRRRDGDDAISR